MKSLKSMRLHIGVFGKTNVGKSSILNRITNQEISIVSDIAGTTTDVVEKSMELLPIGPVTFLDTAGLDDTTELGEKRIEKTMKVLNRIDVAIIVCNFDNSKLYISAQQDWLDDCEKELIKKLEELKIPYLIVVNKCDLNDKFDKNCSVGKTQCPHQNSSNKPSPEFLSSPQLTKKFNPLTEREVSAPTIIFTSAKTDDRLVFKFKEALVKLLPEDFVNSPKIVGDLVSPKSTVILVIPIDKEAPKGRIILPQVQTLRDLLDNNCLTYVVKETELKDALAKFKKTF